MYCQALWFVGLPDIPSGGFGQNCVDSSDPQGCYDAAQNSDGQWTFIIVAAIVVFVIYKAYQWVSDDISSKAAAKLLAERKKTDE